MSIVGRTVDLLLEELYPDLFESKPVSPKHKSRTAFGKGPGVSTGVLFADNSGNIHITFQENTHKKPIIRRRPGPIIEPVSILGKRKLVQAFGEEIYNDRDRYGQDIPADFFDTNVGHGVFK